MKNLNEYDLIPEIKKIRCEKKRLRVLKRLKTQVEHEIVKLKKSGVGIEPAPFVPKVIIRTKNKPDGVLGEIPKV
ncbi:hypothetical protein MAC3UK_0043 [Bdellovibrio phage MAC3UK]|nr:hypothetical protein MAC3UK_0043 [Bdellovibrio phage MAC3UK]